MASISLMTEIVRIIPGCNFVAAYNGRDGVALAKSSSPDLILMDINLPGFGGFETLELLRNDQRTCDIPVSRCLQAPRRN
ncbi:MAG: response regulator [Xanthomonadales bacterium]|nr:response regulator [Xanthomonadales bacterium]